MAASVGFAAAVALAACAVDEDGVPGPGPGREAPQGRDRAGNLAPVDWIDRVGFRMPTNEVVLDVGVAPFFQARPFDGSGPTQRILLTWSEPGGGTLHAGLLSADGRLVRLSSIQRATPAAPAYAIGGPPGQRRIFVAWIESNPWRLLSVVLDTEGRMTATRAIASAVAIGRLRMAGTPTGAVIGFAWSDDPAAPNMWDPWTVTLDLAGAPQAPVRIANAVGQATDVGVAAGPDGDYAVLFRDSGPRVTFLRRFDAAGRALEAPLSLGAASGGDTLAQVVALDGSQRHALIIGLPTGTGDLRMLSAPLTAAAPSELGSLGSVIPDMVSTTFAWPVSSLHVTTTVVGGQPTVLIGLRRVLERDPNYIGCLEAPPIHAEYQVQAVSLAPLRALGSATVLDWRRLTATEQAPDWLQIVPNPDGVSAGVLWLDDGLHLQTVALRAGT